MTLDGRRLSYCMVVLMAGRRYTVWGQDPEDAARRVRSYWGGAARCIYVVRVRWLDQATILRRREDAVRQAVDEN